MPTQLMQKSQSNWRISTDSKFTHSTNYPQETLKQGEANMSAHPATSEASIDSVSTYVTEIKGTPINLSEIIRKISSFFQKIR